MRYLKTYELFGFGYDITPCKWESMELVKEITSLLQKMNDKK